MTMAGSGTLYITATTMTLTGIVASQIGNVFACRTERESVFRAGFFGNKLVLWGVATEIAIILLLMYTPLMQKVFGLSPLAFRDWAFLLLFPPFLLLMDEARKQLMRRTA